MNLVCAAAPAAEFFDTVTKAAFLDWLAEHGVCPGNSPNNPNNMRVSRNPPSGGAGAVSGAARANPSRAGMLWLERAEAEALCSQIDYFSDLEAEAADAAAASGASGTPLRP